MIEFVVEDGTSKTDSTSYASTDQFLQYWTNRGQDYSTCSTDMIKAWLNLSTEYIDNNYNFQGTRSDNDQALEWPRNGMTRKDGDSISSDEIPSELINATCYLALQAKSNDLEQTENNISSITYGKVSKTFKNSTTGKKFKTANKYLRDFVFAGLGLVRVN